MTKGELEIQFGNEFTHKFEGKTRKYVVLDLGEESWFSAAAIMSVAGKEALGFPGTSDRQDVDKITGTWDLERIIQAINNNFGAGESILKLLQENSTKPPRTIT